MRSRSSTPFGTPMPTSLPSIAHRGVRRRDHRRRVSQLGLLCLIACALALAPRKASAQDCVGTTTIVPCNATFARIPNSHYIDTLTVTNTGSGITGTASYTFTCANFSSPVTACSVSPTSSTLGGGQAVKVAMSYTTGSSVAKGGIEFDAWANKPGDSAIAHNGVVTSYLTTSSKFTSTESRQMNRCAVNCFAATYSQSTIPYLSLDVPRSVTLHYDGDQVAVRPTVYATATLATGYPSGTVLKLQVKVNGSLVTFLNGEQTLSFSTSGVIGGIAYRLVGGFDASSYANASWPMQIVVTAAYPTYTEQTIDSTHRLVVVNNRQSPIARGWTIAGVSRHYWSSDGTQTYEMNANGEGTAEQYGPDQCFAWGCIWPGSLGASGTLYYRSANPLYGEVDYPDSSAELFSASGYLVMRIGRLHDTVTFGYDAQNRVTSISDPFRMYGGAHTYTVLRYNTYGLSQIQEPGTNGAPGAGRLTTITVGSDSTLRSIQDPDGVSTSFIYDGVRRLSEVVDRAGDTTRYDYTGDSAWKLVKFSALHVPIDIGGGSTKDSTIATTFVPWQTAGLPLTPTASSPAYIGLDSSRASITDPGGHTVAMTVDVLGGTRTLTDPLNNRTVMTAADTNLAPLSVLLPTGGTNQYTYQGILPTTITRSGAVSTQLMYLTGHMQADSEWGNGAPSLRRFFGQFGVVDSLRVGSNANRVTHYTHDQYGRLVSQRDPLGHTTLFFYDLVFGNLDSTLSPGNRVTVKRFDGYGRDSVVRQNGTPWRTTLYDLMNRTIKYYDGVNANPTTYTFNGLYETRAQDPAGTVYRREVDSRGQTTKLYDPGDTLNTFSTYRRNADGLVTSATNRRSQMLTLAFDALHRLTSKGGTGAVSTSYSYANNHLTETWTAPTSVVNIYRDLNGFTDSVGTTLNGKSFVIHYQPDSALRVSKTTVTSPTSIAFMSRHVGRNDTTATVDTIQLGGRPGWTTTFRHDLMFRPNGAKYPGGVLTSGDSATALLSQYRAEFLGGGATVDNAMNQKYGIDSLLRVNNSIPVNTSLNEWANTQFRYDMLNRLTSVREQNILPANFASTCQSDTTNGFSCTAAPNPGDTINYDGANNIVSGTIDGGSTSATVAAGNRVTAFRGVTYAYDKDGEDTTDGTRRFFWSSDGLLDSVHAGSVSLHYEYDGMGRLVKRSRNGTAERYFLWDGDQLLAELDGTASNRVAEYAYNPTAGRPFALILGSTVIGSVSYYHQDRAINNILGLVRSDSTGSPTLQEQYTYDELGANTVVVDSLSANRLRWKLLFWEGDSTRLYYAHARWYDPVLGRFLSEDPAAGAGTNRYVFGAGDPVNALDPSGQCPTELAEDDAPCEDDPGDDDTGDGAGSVSVDVSVQTSYYWSATGNTTSMDGPPGWTNSPPSAPGVYLGLRPIPVTSYLSAGAGEAGHFVIAIVDDFGNETFTELLPSGGVNKISDFVLASQLSDPNLSDYEWTQLGGTDMIPSLDQAIMTEMNLYNGQIYYADTQNSNTFATDVLIAAGIQFPKGRYWAPLVPVAACWNATPCGRFF
jgi:RHS repeat-associated protein